MSTTFKATIEHVNHTTSRASVRTHGPRGPGVAKGGLDLSVPCRICEAAGNGNGSPDIETR
jgi:hypothetical protein